MAKLVTLNEAAQMLGITPDELNDLRQRNEIYGYRDGASWKFKTDDIERLQQERGAGSSDFLLPMDSDVPLGVEKSSSGPSSDLPFSLADSDAALKDVGSAAKTPPSSGLPLGLSDSDALLADAPSTHGVGGARAPSKAGAKPVDDDSFVLGSPSDLQFGVEGDPSASKTVLKSGSGLFSSQGSVQLGGESLVDSPSGGSSILLGDDREDVLGGGGPPSDITHRPGDSGILLIDPADSGISLERPIDLGAKSDVKLQGSGTHLIGETIDMADGLGIKADDDFLLTPLEEAGEEDSESGSQVIMLDSEGEFEDVTATLMSSQLPGLAGGLEDVSPLGMATAGRGAAGPAGGVIIPPGMVVVPKETPYSVLSVFGLLACTVAMAMCGVMMYDLARNVWRWDTTFPISSTLMDAMLGM